MSGHHKWSTLADRVKARPGASERLQELRRRTLQEGESWRATMAQLRREQQLTQTDLAATLRVSRAEISHWESQPDLLVSTLERYLGALGGELELAAVFPDGTRVRLYLDPPADPEGSQPPLEAGGAPVGAE